MTIKERILSFLEENGIRKIDFYEKTGLAASNFKGIGLNSDLGGDKIVKVLTLYPTLSPDWLLTGTLPMLRENLSACVTPPNRTSLITKNEDLKDSSVKGMINHNCSIIKYYPSISGSMGGVTFLDDPDENTLDLIVPGFSNCKFAINTFGDSMHPVIKSGQVILLQEWTETFIEWGKIYLVVTKGGHRAVKYLMPSINTGCVVCKSENDLSHPSFEVNCDDINKLFLVKGWICRDSI